MAVFRQEVEGGEVASQCRPARQADTIDHEVFLAPLCPFA